VCSECLQNTQLLKFGIEEKLPVCNSCVEEVERDNAEVEQKREELRQQQEAKAAHDEEERQRKEREAALASEDLNSCKRGDTVVKVHNKQLVAGVRCAAASVAVCQVRVPSKYQTGQLLDIQLADGTPKTATVTHMNPDGSYAFFYTAADGTTCNMNAPPPLCDAWAVSWTSEGEGKQKKKKAGEISHLVIQECSLNLGLQKGVLLQKKKELTKKYPQQVGWALSLTHASRSLDMLFHEQHVYDRWVRTIRNLSKRVESTAVKAF